MKNLLLNKNIYALAETNEVKAFENVLKTNHNWDVNTIHRKGDFLVSCSYNYSMFIEGLDIPVKADIEQGMFCIYSMLESRIVNIIIFAESDQHIKPAKAENVLTETINKLIKEYHEL